MPYISAVQDDKNKVSQKVDPETNDLDLRYIDIKDPEPEKSIEGLVLDELGLHKYCCRRMMITNVHAISYIS